MENQNKEEGFSFTYSAKEQEEIKSIRKKYVTQEESEDKMEQLRRLDKNVYNMATTKALVIGIFGALVLGVGMSLILTDLGMILGGDQMISMLVGIAIGILGIVLVCFAYPVYNKVIKKEREKIAPEIIRLTNELMK